MRMVIGVDWSEEAFDAVKVATGLYRPKDVALVHAVDLGWFRNPIVAEAGNIQGYDDYKRAMEEWGRQLMTRTAAIVPKDISSLTQISELAKPAKLVLDTADKRSADLIAIGARGHGRVAEWLLGSVSHRIVLHAPCTTLIVKRPSKAASAILVAIEAPEDAGRITGWLRRFPFRDQVAVTVLHVIQPIPEVDDLSMLPTGAWQAMAREQAEQLVNQAAHSLAGSYPSITTRVLTGNPAEQVAQSAEAFDLLVVGSHARSGLDRFLLGSVSQALLHKAPCSVLVVREHSGLGVRS